MKKKQLLCVPPPTRSVSAAEEQDRPETAFDLTKPQKYLIFFKGNSQIRIFRHHRMKTDDTFIRLALEQARLALERGEVPVGAVVTCGGEILSTAHNGPITLKDPSAHAEMLAIRRAAEKTGNYRLAGATLYVTLEPCIMCAGAILQARISRVVYGADDPKNGGVVSLYRLFEDRRLNHTVAVTRGIQKEICAEILSGFFREKRISSAALSE
jgi:tRNA(adenine34) deaminase